MKPKVTFIIDNLIVAGAEVHLHKLACGLRGAGYRDLEVVSLSGEGAVRSWLEADGIPVQNFGMKSIRRPSFFLDFARLVLHLARRKPDVVHTYLDTANVFGVLAARMAGVSRIMTSRRDLGVFRSRRMERLIGRLSNGVDKVVCVCAAAASECARREGLHGRNLEVIRNGIDLQLAVPPGGNRGGRAPLFCNIGVPNRKEKGHADLIEAFRLVLASVPEARLRLVGEGCLLPALRRQAQELGIAGSVEFVGTSFDIAGALAGASAFVLASHSEGISNALLEAMSLGVVPVVSGVGGNLEVVQDGVTGVVVQAQSPDSIAEGMLRVLGDPQRALELGRAAQRRVREEFSFARMIADYDRLYSAAAAGGAP